MAIDYESQKRYVPQNERRDNQRVPAPKSIGPRLQLHQRAVLQLILQCLRGQLSQIFPAFLQHAHAKTRRNPKGPDHQTHGHQKRCSVIPLSKRLVPKRNPKRH